MVKFNQKKIIFFLIAALGILFVSSLIAPLRPAVINTCRFPLIFLSFIGREAKALIFYHHNFIENRRLRNEVDLLTQRLNALNEASLENARLKNLLSFKKDSSYKVIASQVIGRSADNWSSAVVINKGRFHGVETGSVAVSFLGLLGKVVDAGSLTSRVLLINDPNLSVSAIDQRSRQEGLVSGTLENSLIMRYLPKDADIAIGDVIVSSGLTQSYPKGLLIGHVVDITEEFSGLNKYALIKPAVNLSNIEEVLIIVR